MNFHWVRISKSRWMRTLKPNMTWKAKEDTIFLFCWCNLFISSHMQMLSLSQSTARLWIKLLGRLSLHPAQGWTAVVRQTMSDLVRVLIYLLCELAQYKSCSMTHIEKYAGLSALMVRLTSLCLTVWQIRQGRHGSQSVAGPLPSNCTNSESLKFHLYSILILILILIATVLLWEVCTLLAGTGGRAGGRGQSGSGGHCTWWLPLSPSS